MDNDALKKIEKRLFLVFLLLGVVVVIGILFMIRWGKETPGIQEEAESGEEMTYDWEAGLSDSTVWFPDNCILYSKIPELLFYDEQNKLHSIREFEGKPTIVVFWASWCEDCKEQMPRMQEFCEMIPKETDLNFVFINKTDGEKETKESAAAYFEKLGISWPLYYDVDLKSYEMLGMHNIPTTLFLDEEGIVTVCSPKQITQSPVYTALLEKALYGGSYATGEFIKKEMMDETGAVHSEYGKTASSDVLSESEGLMLKYAVKSGNQQLFDQVSDYIETNLLNNGLVAWKISNGETAKVNALLDDQRIYGAMKEADKQWGGYSTVCQDYFERLKKYGMKDNQYVDFYDEENKLYAQRFTLCYGDLTVMKELGEGDAGFEAAYEKALEIIKAGQISEDFPLYYSWYNYDKKKYEKDDLNTAEAMVTLVHLAEAGILPDNALSWLRTRLEHEGLKARYDVNGNVVEGYDYDSTAVYALAAIAGARAGDEVIVSQAVKKMEKMRNDDSSLAYNGAFGMEDGTGITSFDQLVPLVAYMEIYGK